MRCSAVGQELARRRFAEQCWSLQLRGLVSFRPLWVFKSTMARSTKCKNAVLRSESILGNSEHSFGLRLIADEPFIFSEKEIGPIFSSIRRAAAENESHFCFPLFLQLVLGFMHFLCCFCFLFCPLRQSLCKSRILQPPCLPLISVLVRILRSRSKQISVSSRWCVLLSPWFLSLCVA